MFAFAMTPITPIIVTPTMYLGTVQICSHRKHYSYCRPSSDLINLHSPRKLPYIFPTSRPKAPKAPKAQPSYFVSEHASLRGVVADTQEEIMFEKK